MTFVKPVANLIPGLVSLSLVGRSVQMIPKDFKKKKSTKKMIGGFTDIMIGTTMLKPISTSVAAL
jgi:hypothetical protein